MSSDSSDVFALYFQSTSDIELEVDGRFFTISTTTVPEVIRCLSESYFRAKGDEVSMAANERRYLQLRNADIEAIQKGGIFAGITPDNVVVNGEDLDQALDAVRDQEVLRTGGCDE